MKKYLYSILLFVSCNVCRYETVYAQIVINKTYSTVSTTTTNGTAFGINSSTLTAGKLYLFIATTTGTTNNGTITATTTTWTNVANVGDATRRVQIFRCVPSSTVSGESVQLGTFGGGSTGYSVAIWEITGVPTTGTNGSDAIVQAVTATGTATANPSITMSGLANSNSAVIAVFANSLNPFGGTAESGWTEDFDSGYTTPDAGSYYMSRLTTTDNTPTVTASASDWAGVAIELKSLAKRRVIIVN